LKFHVHKEGLIDNVINDYDRVKLMKKLGDKEYTWGVEVSLYDKKTTLQNNAIWRDYDIVASLLYTNRNCIYETCRVAPRLFDHWVVEDYVGKPGQQRIHKRIGTLSELDKDRVSELIEPQRDLMQSWVDKEYQQHVVIYWSWWKNKQANKPKWEFQEL